MLSVLYSLNRHTAITLIKKPPYRSCDNNFGQLLVGVIVNMILGWNVWDYSGMPLNQWVRYVFRSQ